MPVNASRSPITANAAAVLINPQELADLEDALALALYRERQSTGKTGGVPHDDVRARLGLERG